MGVIQDLAGTVALVGHAKIVLTRDQDVRFADVWLQKVPENLAAARRIDLCV
jgi:hypothetical protein